MPRFPVAAALLLVCSIISRATGDAGQPVPGTPPVPAEPAKPHGNVWYTFHAPPNPSDADAAIIRQMIHGLDLATECYSKNAPGVRIHVNVYYSPGTPTADGSSNGTIRLGRNCRDQRVCMHEIAHTLGVGTHPRWGKLVVNGVFTGKNATHALREITKNDAAVLHADRMHFWPYGLNYDKEVKSPDDFIAHCKIVSAILLDLKNAR